LVSAFCQLSMDKLLGYFGEHMQALNHVSVCGQFPFAMGDAVDARDEQHDGGDHEIQGDGVVAGHGCKATGGETEIGGGFG
jgi:hypothetical protein